MKNAHLKYPDADIKEMSMNCIRGHILFIAENICTILKYTEGVYYRAHHLIPDFNK